ncbi:MAG: protein NrnU [Betaproteobacteria bacterium]|nr:protein NrnU [Betaproteobacteria bacterium]
MTLLVLGLVLFLGAHSVRIFAEDWRRGCIARIGEGPWKGLYSVVSVAGFVLICLGIARTRAAPVMIWHPPLWTAHVTALLTLVAFVLLASAYVPRNRIRSAIGHPMVAGVKVWALAHLLSNGRLADIVLFGAFLLWAVLDFRAARRRDRTAGTVRTPGTIGSTVVAIVVGVVAWAAFAFYLHGVLIGVRPLG